VLKAQHVKPAFLACFIVKVIAVKTYCGYIAFMEILGRLSVLVKLPGNLQPDLQADPIGNNGMIAALASCHPCCPIRI
jgi:hypothetical protein